MASVANPVCHCQDMAISICIHANVWKSNQWKKGDEMKSEKLLKGKGFSQTTLNQVSIEIEVILEFKILCKISQVGI